MKEISPPWSCPAVCRAKGGGSKGIGAFGKPLETMGRKARGLGAGGKLRRSSNAMLVRLRYGKPSETMGQQSQGPTV